MEAGAPTYYPDKSLSRLGSLLELVDVTAGQRIGERIPEKLNLKHKVTIPNQCVTKGCIVPCAGDRRRRSYPTSAERLRVPPYRLYTVNDPLLGRHHNRVAARRSMSLTTLHLLRCGLAAA